MLMLDFISTKLEMIETNGARVKAGAKRTM